MSRFGPSKVTGERSSSPSGKRPPSPQSSPKKRAFVSTIKSVDTFGVPPPLPSVLNSPDGKLNLDQIVPDIGYGIISEPDALASSHVHLLQKQSVRWLNLSLNLWSLTVLDVYRAVSLESIAQFLEVVSWRAHGKINEEEFSVLYSEWVAKPEKGAPGHSKRVTVGVFGVRQLLLEKKYGETDLDLCIGILIHEINMRLLNSSVSYVSKKSTSGNHQNPFSLEVCSPKWLALCEELFFTLDTPGYGILHFDEAFFYCTCVAVGMQGWNNEEELEADLSLATLTAATMQFMSDTGANICVRSGQQENELFWALEGPVGKSSGKKSAAQASALHSQPKSSNGKCEITLSMFKRYFLKRNVGEASLAALLAHVQGCIERVVRLARVNGAEELYQACRPFETELGSIGSARLWKQAVLSASGYTPEFSPMDGRGVGPASPPILLFLLSDAERILSGALRANELPTDGTGFVARTSNSEGASSGTGVGGVMDSATTANEELHESVYKLWNQFRKWGSDSSSSSTSASGAQGQASVGGALGGGKANSWGLGGSGSSLHHPSSFFALVVNQADLADVQRDPVYQLILTAVLQYKALQQLLLAAFYDMTLTHFGVGENNPSQGAAAPLVVVCAGLAPNPHRLLVEMGFTEEKSWNDSGGVVGARASAAKISTPTRGETPQGSTPSAVAAVASPVISSQLQQAVTSASAERPERSAAALARSIDYAYGNEAPNTAPQPPVRRRRGQQMEITVCDSDSDFPNSVQQSSASVADRLKADTASSAAKQRPSQRIQENRRAAQPGGGGEGDSSSTARSGEEFEQELAQAKWSPLFSSAATLSVPTSSSSQQTTAAATAATDASAAKREGLTHATLTNKSAGQDQSFGEKSAATMPAQPGTSTAAAYSLSDEEAILLSEILSTSDVTTQNQLIARMKKLRLKEEPPAVKAAAEASSRPPATSAVKVDNAASDSDNNKSRDGRNSSSTAFTQFQKLEENVLSEYDKRLSGNLHGLSSSAQKADSLASNQPAAPESTEGGASDLGSIGPSSVSQLGSHHSCIINSI